MCEIEEIMSAVPRLPEGFPCEAVLLEDGTVLIYKCGDDTPIDEFESINAAGEKYLLF